MATLEGWARPTDYLFFGNVPGGAEHTYVVSGEGKRWGCGGGDTGGRLITSGGGSHRKANCLSQNNSGIAYGINGVCHQIANRILYAAGRLVLNAKGYAFSVASFGTYGRDPGWAAFIAACELNDLIPFPRLPKIPKPKWPPWRLAVLSEADLAKRISEEIAAEEHLPSGAEQASDKEHEAVYFKSVFSLYSDPTLTIEQRLAADFQLLIRFRLNGNLASSRADDIANLQQEANRNHACLVNGFFAGAIPKRDFVQEACALSVGTHQRMEKLLGEKAYTDVFDLPPECSPGVLNPGSVEG